MPTQKNITLVVHNWHHNTANITLDNEKVNSLFDEQKNTLTVQFIWQQHQQPLTLEIK
jgi:hypothetical protein